jgi:uncharacterized protein YndB with AHSA1/START domain
MTITAEPTTTTQIRHRIGMDVPQEQVHRALATTEGLASWWTSDTTGDAGEGGTLTFTFGAPDRVIVFEVLDVARDRIVWRGLPGGPPEWVDTTVTFELARDGEETVLVFTHAGWREPGWFQAHCSTKWATYLVSLKALVDTGQGAPFPGDVRISSWD